jgi:hypothetical protein
MAVAAALAVRKGAELAMLIEIRRIVRGAVYDLAVAESQYAVHCS